MGNSFIASCDRKEGTVAVLIRDGDEREFTVRAPLSACLTEGGVYECCEEGGRIVRVLHLTKEEKKRREASVSLLSRLFGKNK
ncbi:MAG: hypothetical protein E7601_09920 [Ruminococcaceae bacterium]|nr:hypothetical protein [Oscillospiraceae bacterium]